MYLRITRGQFDPSKAEVLEAFGSEVNAALKRLPGCQAVYQGTDRARGTTVAVSVWDTERNARFDRSAMGTIVGRMQAAGLRLEVPEVFELVEAESTV